ncbi:MBL fold metallo-hydrolase [Aliidiomarina iranensis]|uniref:MBL fold metallo-hydrolase n=1 Tax=Aliidiomarina iranensis TaxID=1434071 RepID=A0A432VWI0_9GAMM|nr:MBL fold metallo-hydrolase [Aliidiomarina iranensis]RUO20918.1 MBL fold metallo-hydrolase [Aliidiomarina iranensis]
MNIEFLGPLGRVTGSCTWMYDKEKDWNFLVDCGIQQGEGNSDVWNQGVEWPFEPREIKFVLLTHAHVDHCGLIPLLYKKGFQGKVICTSETAAIARVMLADAVKLCAFYDESDVAKIKWFEPRGKSLLGGALHPIDDDLYINFYRTSHIIGAVAIGVYWGDFKAGKQKKIVFSGDLGVCNEDSEHLPLLRHIMKPHEFDYAVIESTYGGKVRSTEEQTVEFRWNQIQKLCDQVVANDRGALLPSFSLGRAQDLLFDLHWILNSKPEKYSNIELVFDSPTANKLTPIILQALERTEVTGKSFKKARPLWLGKQIFRWFELDDTDPNQVDRLIDIVRMTLGEVPKFPEYAGLFGNQIAKSWASRVRVISERNQREEIPENGSQIVIASSGSCDGGAVTHWLPKVVRSERNLICLTGFSGPASVAGQLSNLQGVERSERRRLRGSIQIESANLEIPIRDISCQITTLNGYSGHADQTGLLNWLFWSFKGESRRTAPFIFIQHGNDNERKALKKAICEKNGKESLTVKLPSRQTHKYRL